MAHDTLSDPPNSVGDEFEPLGFVEAFGSSDQSNVPLGNEVFQGEAMTLILLGHRNHKSQVGIYQFVEGQLVTLLDSNRKGHLMSAVIISSLETSLRYLSIDLESRLVSCLVILSCLICSC